MNVDKRARKVSKVKGKTDTDDDAPKTVQDPFDESTKMIRFDIQKGSNPEHDPIVVSFPSGLPRGLVEAQSRENRKVRFEQPDFSATQEPVFTWKRRRESKGKVIMGIDDQCTYTASNIGRGHDDRKTKLYVGILDKETNTLKMIPAAERGTVFSLDQSVISYQQSGNELSNTLANMSSLERRNLLFESFGSSKKMRAIKSKAANVVSMTSVVGAGDGMMEALKRQNEDTTGTVSKSNLDAMDAVRESGVEQKLDAVAQALMEARKAFLPPFDMTADAPYKVYDSQEIAGDEPWDQISRELDACLQKSSEVQGWKSALMDRAIWSESTISIMNGIHNVDKKGMKYRIKTIVLLNHLINFHKKCSKTFMKGTAAELAKFMKIPPDVCNRFLELFLAPTQNQGCSGYAVTKQLKDKCIVHILILYLIAHGRDMKVASINRLCEDIKVEVRDAITIVREAGCKCAKDKLGCVSVSLTVPLEFPPPKRSKK